MIALDIGTRTLIAAEVIDGTVTRLAHREHAGTPMRGGQVQDLAAVAAGVRALREELGLDAGTPASMAVAGGLLRAEAIPVSVLGPGPWTEEDLRAAETDALTRARTRSPVGDSSPKGPTERSADRAEILLGLVRARMTRDGEPVGSLVGMAGGEGTWLALASWLPVEQVRLKMEAVAEGGFHPRTITVEPLAVSAALFGAAPPPATYAVIDIGAGTSDIAVFTPSGLAAAASVPLAGDTITASIASALSLDHLAADHLKRDPETPVRDLWGDEKRHGTTAVSTAAAAGADAVARAVAERLMTLSPTVPAGVILVGGGSLWHDIPARIASALGLPPERVRRRSAETVAGVSDATGSIHGPAFLTLLGIIVSESQAYARRDFRRDGVSGWTLARIDTPFTVGDALARTGDDPLAWFGAPGRDPQSGAWNAGAPPVVTVNGRTGSLDSPLRDGDDFTIARADTPEAPGADSGDGQGNGVDAARNFESAPGDRSAPQAWTRSARDEGVAPVADLDGRSAPGSARMVTLDGESVTLEDVPAHADEAWILDALRRARDTRGYVTVDGRRTYVGERRRYLRVEPGVYVSRDQEPPVLAGLVPLPPPRTLTVLVNGSETTVRDATSTVLVDGVRQKGEASVAWNAEVRTDRGPWRLYEVLAAHEGRASSASLNGSPAAWTAEVRPGDRVEFR